ncbi:hypothetical protein AgCh_030341 [Apium graveolens]
MQISVIDFARSVLGLEKPNSSKFDAQTLNHVVIFMPEGMYYQETSRTDQFTWEYCKNGLASTGMAISALLEGKTNTPKLIPQLDNRASFFNLFASSPVTVTAFTFHINDYDFVITTYSIVEAEYRKNVMPAKHKCIWCGKLLFYEHKISIHLKYFGGPNAIRTNKQSKQKKGKNPELNRSEKGKGVESVDEGKEESSKKGKHYNKDKTFGAGSSTNKSEGVEYGSCNGKSTLHSVKWDRIILEEVSREHKGKIYEVIDEARVFVEVVRVATYFASADTIYGFAAYPSGENCLGNAALVS